MTETCENCRFGHRPGQPFDGLCHFYPDQKWVVKDYWCGKWQDTKPEKAGK